MRANLVRFAPCARTHWHSHALGQTLHDISGVVEFQVLLAFASLKVRIRVHVRLMMLGVLAYAEGFMVWRRSL
ncbi:hypothetical protein ACGFZR_00895 [Streptomyces sp. NPDC048241]|uniref:hypothetical protein n=1 Tax=Streptomyces sp. NPDC048241 TaxID=3365521 RepID=UPI003723BB8C